MLSAATLFVWLVNPFAALMLIPALHLWLIAAIADVPRRGPVPVLLVIGGLLPFAAVVLYYLDRLALNPLEGVWYLFLLVMGGGRRDLREPGRLRARGRLRVARWPCSLARARKPPEARVEEPEQPSVFGPGGYAGPGALGGTRSALRR